tara:strand:- start:1710 stop:2336 length:627 start_codon:yes stop_codon:yes gene_type:complete
MALTNFDELVKQVTDWSHREDLGTLMPDFISLTENAMYANETEVLTVRSMETTSTILSTGRLLSLPIGFESARSIRLLTNDGGGELRFQAPEQMLNHPFTGRPQFFTVIGDKIQLDRTPDAEYTVEIQYFKKADPLTSLNQTNEILTKYPSIYLYGALAQVFIYSQDDQQVSKYIQLFIGAIKGANKADQKGRFGPAMSMSLDRGMIV